MSAVGTAIAMTAELCRAAAHDGIHDLAVLPGKMRSVALAEAVAGATKDVGHLKGGPTHRFLRLPSLPVGTEAAMASVSSGLGTASICRRERCR